ncbi:MAG: hypothetical protein WBQ89_13605 [Candidatus Acidiferrum sp.]
MEQAAQQEFVPLTGNEIDYFTSGNVQLAVFIILSAILVLPIWLVKYPPLIDYPDHLARAFVLHHLHDPHYDFARWYAPDWGPNPYLLADLLMQVFQSAAGIYVAGRLMLTLCVLGLPWGVLFFLRRANPGSAYLALWAFALAYNRNFLMGFMSFQLSIALCFVVVGVWLDYLRNDKTSTYAVSMVLTTMLYLTHLGGYAIAALAIGIYTLMRFGMNRKFWLSAIPFVPGALFFLSGEFNGGWAKRGLDYRTWHFSSKLKGMLVPFILYSRPLGLLTMLVVLATAVYFLWRRDKLKLNVAWIVVAIAIVAVHWIMPGMYGDLGFVNYRFCIVAFLFVLAVPRFAGARNWIVAVAVALCLLRTADVTKYFVSQQKPLAEMTNSFKYIPKQALVLPYSSIGDHSWIEDARIRFWAYGVIERGWISPSLYHQAGVQPLRLRVPICAENDQDGRELLESKYTIEAVRETYPYVWANDISYLDPLLELVASPIFDDGELKIYKRKDTPVDTATSASALREAQLRARKMLFAD